MGKKETKRSKRDIKTQNALDQKFKDSGLESDLQVFGNEVIIQKNIGDATIEYTCLFAANKNLYRITPRLQDGLKPGAGRLLYMWWLRDGSLQNTKSDTLRKRKFYKVARLSTDTMAIHPHGDSGIVELIGRLGQPWSNNVMLLVPQGSYGNQRGDQSGAGRYIEAMMSEFTIDCFFSDFDKYCIPMKTVYDGSMEEPEYLPAKYPYVLFNPQFSSIGVGMASNIPPFNVGEVLDATIKLMRNPDAKILLIPDSPTGCDIIDSGDFKKINKTGKGKVIMQSSYDIDYNKNEIRITTMPYNSDTADMISKIIEMREKGDDVLQSIVGIDDKTINGNVDVIIRLDNKAETKPDKVMARLLKKSTGLKQTFPCGITVVDDYEDYEYGVKDLLLTWIDYRLDIVRSMLLNNLGQMLNKQHMNEVLLMVFNKSNIDDTIKIAKNASSRKETIEKLMKRFDITSVQAATIADMHVYNFNQDSYNRYLEEQKELKEDIKNVKEILTDDDKIREFVIEQLEEGKKKYGTPRRSKVIKLDGAEDDIPDTEHIIGVSESGIIKKVSTKNTSIGPVGKSNEPVVVLQVNNRESLLIADSDGMISKVSISAIPNMEFEDPGIPLNQLFTVNGKVCGMMELPSMDILDKDDENLCVSFITKKGFAKRVKISEFKDITKSKKGISLEDGDEVAVANFDFGGIDNDMIIYTDDGNGIRIPISELRVYGCNSKGLQCITLNGTEQIIGASRIKKGKRYLFFITSNGRCKITDAKFFPEMKRNADTMNLTSVVNGEVLIGVSSVDKGDIVMVYRKKGEPVEIKVSDLPVVTRMAACEKMIKTDKGDRVVGFKVFAK